MAAEPVAPLDETFQLLGGGLNGTIGAFWSWVCGGVAIVAIVASAFVNRRKRQRFGFVVRPLAMEIAGLILWSALVVAFAVWMVWSVVVARLPSIGYTFTTDQLFWLAAVPGISGATLRIFYAFLVPIFGGRLWTTLSTASLLIPAFGIGYAVQNPNTPYTR